MATVEFTSNLDRHVKSRPHRIEASTLRDLLDQLFAIDRDHQRLKGYVLDDQNRLREHMLILIDGRPVRDRVHLSEPLQADSKVFILQALSGG